MTSVSREATRALGVEYQLLRHDALESRREHRAYLLLLVRREHVDHTVDRLGRVLGVERPEDEVTGLGRGERHRDRLEVTHLTDQNDVGVLTKDSAERLREGVRVLADLALVHDRPLVIVEEFDRVLDRDDVKRLGPVDDVDERREGRRLSRSRRPGDEHEASPHLAERADRLWNPERVEYRDLVGNRPERRCHRPALAEDVHPEPAHTRYRVGRVELLLVLEALALARRQDPEDHLPDGLVVEYRASLDRSDGAVEADAAGHLGREVQVGCPDAHRVTQQVVDVERNIRCRCGCRLGRSERCGRRASVRRAVARGRLLHGTRRLGGGGGRTAVAVGTPGAAGAEPDAGAGVASASACNLSIAAASASTADTLVPQSVES